jgi:uncharacterized protein YcbX
MEWRFALRFSFFPAKDLVKDEDGGLMDLMDLMDLVELREIPREGDPERDRDVVQPAADEAVDRVIVVDVTDEEVDAFSPCARCINKFYSPRIPQSFE